MKSRIFKILIGAYVSLSMLACCTIQAKTQVVSRSDEGYISQVVRLQSKSKDGTGQIILATGFAYTKDILLTAGHFCSQVLVGQINGKFQDKVSMSFVEDGMVKTLDGGLIVALDEKSDLCAIYLPQDKIIPLALLDRPLHIGEKITITGAPLGFFPVITRGHVISLKSENLPPEVNGRLIVGCTATFGNSGGPIINEEGKVVGMVFAIPTTFPHIVFGVRVETIQAFLDKFE